MRNSKAKKLRKLAYGELSQHGTTEYEGVPAQPPRQRHARFIARGRTLLLKQGSPRHNYKNLKRACV